MPLSRSRILPKSRNWSYYNTTDFLNIGIVAAASLLLNVPLLTYQVGDYDIFLFAFFGLMVLFAPVRAGYQLNTDGKRSALTVLHRALGGTFLYALCIFLTSVLHALLPSELPTIGFQYGLTTSVGVRVPYATLDNPFNSNKKYWAKLSIWMAFLYVVLIFFLHGRTTSALQSGLIMSGTYVCGLWIGLWFGTVLPTWIGALSPAFQLLRRLQKTLAGFGAGYLVLILFFASCYSAIWKREGADAFGGLPPSAHFSDFIYLSVITASTTGFGDIVPKTQAARLFASLESIVSIGWTLIVFAAVSVRFSASLERTDETHVE